MTDESGDGSGDALPDDDAAWAVEGEIGDAVDDALEPELKRARARFVQRLVGLDRSEGVGRGGLRWDHESYRRLGLGDPQDPTA